MPMSGEALAELQTMLKKARQKPLPFGLCLGKKPEDSVLYLDLKKSPEVMMRKAKADGETGKLTYGFCAVQGKVVSLTIEGKMLPGLAKNMKIFMVKQNLRMKVVILDPSGNVLESEGDDEDESNTDTATNETEEASNDDDNANDPLMGQWAQVSTALEPHVARFVASGNEKSAVVQTAWSGAEKAAESGDYKSALGVAAKIKPLVMTAPQSDEQSDSNEVDPNQSKWETLYMPMMQLYERAMKTNPAERTKITALWGMASDRAEGGDYAGAIKAVTALKPLLDDALKAGATTQETEIPKDVVAFGKSRVVWAKTKSTMKAEMQKLVSAIEEVCASDPELKEMASEASSLLDRLDVFDERLEDALDEIVNSEAGPARDALKQKAITALQDYRTALSDPFFGDVDSNNGFAKVSVTSSAQASLAGIEKVLAA